MAYDADLADRIRELIGPERALSEKRMFGGLGFLVGGHLAISASAQGGILVRVDPAHTDELVATTPASRAVMGGREMGGWLRVGAEDLGADQQLERWVQRGVSYARSLPPKRAAHGRRPAPS